jgi:hypothetical protein
MFQNASWHFWVMIPVSFIVFLLVIYLVLKRKNFIARRKRIPETGLMVVLRGKLPGNNGTSLRIPWRIYHPVPFMLIIFLPAMLKFWPGKWLYYFLLGFLSVSFIHNIFSFFPTWKEYMPCQNLHLIG